MELKVVTYEVGDGVALITLNRPDRLNACRTRMAQELRWCTRTAASDGAVRVIVLTDRERRRPQFAPPPPPSSASASSPSSAF